MSSVARTEGLPSTPVSDGEVITTPDGTAHYLNGMATLIYELADGREVASIAASVATIFDLPATEAVSLVEESVKEMRAKGLVG